MAWRTWSKSLSSEESSDLVYQEYINKVNPKTLPCVWNEAWDWKFREGRVLLEWSVPYAWCYTDGGGDGRKYDDDESEHLGAGVPERRIFPRQKCLARWCVSFCIVLAFLLLCVTSSEKFCNPFIVHGSDTESSSWLSENGIVGEGCAAVRVDGRRCRAVSVALCLIDDAKVRQLFASCNSLPLRRFNFTPTKFIHPFSVSWSHVLNQIVDKIPYLL